MGVFQHRKIVAQLAANGRQHHVPVGAGEADGIALGDTGGQGNGLGAPVAEHLGAQHGALPGQPPQEMKPTTSQAPIASNEPLPLAAVTKSVVPGQ